MSEPPAGTSIFETMSRLAAAHEAVNLGQGFPDEDGPADVLQVAADALIAGPNQYPPMMGLPELRQAVAEHSERFYGLVRDPVREVIVTTGATEGLAASLLGLLAPGDEAIVLEPLFDTYVPMIERSGAIARPVRLEPPDWRLTRDALAAAAGPRTRLLLVNDPQNPAAKAYTREELELLADLAIAHDLVVVCDEAYEHIVFDGRPHVPLATLPGMASRCLRIGSAGKTFSVTGWKVGYASGPEELVAATARCHQNLVFTTPPALQRAVAYGLRKEDAYFTGLRDGLEAKRDRLAAGLRRLGLEPLPCEGTYFLNVDVSGLGLAPDDAAFCRRLVAEGGVAAIPLSAFYLGEERPRTTIRLCFSKRDGRARRRARAARTVPVGCGPAAAIVPGRSWPSRRGNSPSPAATSGARSTASRPRGSRSARTAARPSRRTGCARPARRTTVARSSLSARQPRNRVVAVRIAVDALGGDRAPEEIVAGARDAQSADIEPVVFGPASLSLPGLTHVHTDGVVAMDDKPADAVRSKPDSSLVRAVRAVGDGEAEAVVSAGNTGAMLAASLLHIKRLPGVYRPGIAIVIPTQRGPTVWIDAGANADARPEHLVQFAHMGSVFAEEILGIAEPDVRLLSIGEEAEKGNQLTLEAHALLAADPRLHFGGNQEGRTLLQGEGDVVVCDGFTGNVALKTLEGTIRSVLAALRSEIETSISARVGRSADPAGGAEAPQAARSRDVRRRLPARPPRRRRDQPRVELEPRDRQRDPHGGPRRRARHRRPPRRAAAAAGRDSPRGLNVRSWDGATAAAIGRVAPHPYGN